MSAAWGWGTFTGTSSTERAGWINAAHASDAAENAQREFKIVQVGENNFKKVVEEVYGKI